MTLIAAILFGWLCIGTALAMFWGLLCSMENDDE